jgi:pimeloyl-ACP methyl ester carboxylesterase
MMLTFPVEGCVHHVLVRGPAEAPVLLLVQAGPGFPMISEADALQHALGLEQHYRVAYWDQRGTGRSVDSSSAPLTMETLVADLEAVVGRLCEALRVSSLAVAGFSLGGTVALLAAARAPMSSLVLVGPDVDFAQSEAFAWQFARAEAIRRGHRRALTQLEALGPPPHDSAARFMTRVRWVTDFGGVFAGASFARLALTTLWRLLRSPFYSVRQVVAAVRGMQATQQRALASLQHFSLLGRRSPVPMPVTVIQGRLDAAAPPALAEVLVEQLDAPRGKRLVWLDDCAHTPHFEAPALFRQVLLEALTPRSPQVAGYPGR